MRNEIRNHPVNFPQKINAEWALRQQWIKLLRQFNANNDEYLRMRQQDVTQVVEKFLLGS